MVRREKVNACKELARRSGQWTSFDPERHAEVMLDDMENGLQEFLDQLPEEVRDDYEDKYISKYKEWLGAQSRCFSQAITGAGGWKPATFRRHEKTEQAERNARKRLDEWCEKVIKRCNRQEWLIGWAEVERLKIKLDELKRAQETMKAANKIIRNKKLAEVEKVNELVALGMGEANALACMEPDFCGRIGFPAYALSNNLAKIKDTEAKIKRHATMAQKENKQKTYDWGTFRTDYADERYRFIFDGKPEQEVIKLMKDNGFKWSPSNKAWQRQITANATFAVKHYIMPKLEEMYKTEN